MVAGRAVLAGRGWPSGRLGRRGDCPPEVTAVSRGAARSGVPRGRLAPAGARPGLGGCRGGSKWTSPTGRSSPGWALDYDCRVISLPFGECHCRFGVLGTSLPFARQLAGLISLQLAGLEVTAVPRGSKARRRRRSAQVGHLPRRAAGTDWDWGKSDRLGVGGARGAVGTRWSPPRWRAGGSVVEGRLLAGRDWKNATSNYQLTQGVDRV